MRASNIFSAMYAAGIICLILANIWRGIRWISYKVYFCKNCKKEHYQQYICSCRSTECKYRRICSAWQESISPEEIDLLKRLIEQYQDKLQGVQK